jgi:hypothetical protein
MKLRKKSRIQKPKPVSPPLEEENGTCCQEVDECTCPECSSEDTDSSC